MEILIFPSTFSVSLSASPVSSSINLPTLILFIRDSTLFSELPIAESLSCVISLITASIEAVFSRLTPALFAIDATFFKPSPMPSAELALFKSMLVSTSEILLPSFAANLKPLIVAVNISEAFSPLVLATLLNTIESSISLFVSSIERPERKNVSALSATVWVKVDSSFPNSA